MDPQMQPTPSVMPINTLPLALPDQAERASGRWKKFRRLEWSGRAILAISLLGLGWGIIEVVWKHF